MRTRSLPSLFIPYYGLRLLIDHAMIYGRVLCSKQLFYRRIRICFLFMAANARRFSNVHYLNPAQLFVERANSIKHNVNMAISDCESIYTADIVFHGLPCAPPARRSFHLPSLAVFLLLSSEKQFVFIK